jgi:hypothetical protein
MAASVVAVPFPRQASSRESNHFGTAGKAALRIPNGRGILPPVRLIRDPA